MREFDALDALADPWFLRVRGRDGKDCDFQQTDSLPSQLLASARVGGRGG
jgi:hypothetical protein